MGQKCIIKTCNNSATKKQQGTIEKVIFHRFPANEIRRDSWLKNIQASASQMKPFRSRSLICSDHFHKDYYVHRLDGITVLLRTAKPTLFGDVQQSCSVIVKLEAQGELESHFGKETESILSSYDPDKVKCEKELIISDIDDDIDASSDCYSKMENIVGDLKSANHAGNTISPKSERKPKTVSQPDDGMIPSTNLVSSVNRLQYLGDVTDLLSTSRGYQVEQSDSICNKKEMDPTGHEFLKLANVYTKSSLSKSRKMALQRFKFHFGVSPTICSIVWQELANDLPEGAQRKHLLWSLSFLKQYSTEHDRRSFFQADEKTVRKWTWIFVKLLSNLNVIK